MAKAKKAVVETPEAKIAEISKDILRVEKEANEIVITDRAGYENASKFLSGTLKPRVNRIKELVELFIKPHQEARRNALEAMRQIENLFAPSLTKLEQLERNVKQGMANFLRAEEEAARKEEERLRKLREKQDERREERGLDPILAPLPTVERQEMTVKGEEGGKTTAKKVWRFEIINYNALPENVIAMVLEEAKQTGLTEKVVRKMVNAGIREISGVRIYEDFEISASASK
jgi:hypothetical protein